MRIQTLLATAAFAVSFSFLFTPLAAQCVIDPNIPAGVQGIYPDTLPPAQGCEFYDVDLTFVFPRDTTVQVFPGQNVTLAFKSFRIDGLAGPPQGVDWGWNLVPDCFYDLNPSNPAPDSVGCIRIYGTPTIPSSYPIVAYVTANLELVGNQPTTFELRLDVLPCQFTGDCYTYSTNTNCQPASLTVSNNVPSNGKAGFGYQWAFSGPGGFAYTTGDENPLPQMLTQAGDYFLSYRATVDTVGFILTEATIENVNCSDLLDAGDLYWILKNPAGTVLLSTQANPVTNGGANLPLVTNLPNFMLDTGTYEFQVWDYDAIGNDDGCADGTGGGGASVFFTIPFAGGGGPLTVINNGLTVTFDILHPIDTIRCTDTIRIDALPVVPEITVLGDAAICEGDTTQLFTTTSDSIQWYKDGLPLLDAHDPTLTVTEAGSYTVEAIGAQSLCTRISMPQAISVYTTLVPSIAYDGNSTFLVAAPNAQFVYTWYRNGVMAGTGASFTATASGAYHATATNNATGCESGPSAAIDATITGLESLAGLASDFRVFPNPNTGDFRIEFEALQVQPMRLRLIDLMGKTVHEEVLPAQAGSISRDWRLSQLAAGMYLLRLESGSSNIQRKVIIR